jgi:hypothetical protein
LGEEYRGNYWDQAEFFPQCNKVVKVACIHKVLVGRVIDKTDQKNRKH